MSLRRWAGDDDRVVDQVRNLIGAFLDRRRTSWRTAGVLRESQNVACGSRLCQNSNESGLNELFVQYDL
jgi:hypothetical protein